MNEIRRRRLSWCLMLVLFLLPVLWGCEMPSSTGSSTTTASQTSSSAQAEKTRKMEEKAAEIHRKEEEIRNMQGTEQEKIDAMNDLDRMRRELADMDSGTP